MTKFKKGIKMSYIEHFKDDFLENIEIGNTLTDAIWAKVDATGSNYLEIGKELFILKRVKTILSILNSLFNQ